MLQAAAGNSGLPQAAYCNSQTNYYLHEIPLAIAGASNAPG